MAGGEGAKERRRLKRLAAQKEKSKSDSTPANAVTDGKSLNKNARGDKNGKIDGKELQFRKNSRQQGSNQKSNSKTNANKEKKPKFKKPKHLKRKLEQVSSENEVAKGEIQKKIEQFEAKKKFFSKKIKHFKRQKTTNNNDSDDMPRNKPNDDNVSRLNEINSKNSSFPRNRKGEEKNPQDNYEEPIILEEITKPDDAIKQDVQNPPKIESEQSSSRNSSADDSSDDDKSDNDSSGEDAERDKENQPSLDNESDGDTSGSESDEDSDEDSDDGSGEDEPVQQRARGRRRRGREDTAKKLELVEAAENVKAGTTSNSKESKDMNDKSEKKRYCIGRKPVTDFLIGQRHEAKVVYVKPFGVFFDIGCHSDAFCHISRLSDDYIESPESMFSEGDVVPNVRIVEIDRKQKRITVSLQSDARLDDERKSIEARKARKEKKQSKTKKTANADSSGHNRVESNPRFKGETTSVSKEPVVKAVTQISPKDPSLMTPAELKRARKLARRAERRVQAEQ